MPAVIRILIVDDSALIRQILTRALALDPRIEVVGFAKDGVEAVRKARELEPDVVTLDIDMPVLSGLEALPFIIRDTDARVIMLSSVDDPDTTYEALALGAIDFVPKPKAGFASSISELSEVLVKKIKTAHRVSPDRRRQALPGELVGGVLVGAEPREPRTAPPAQPGNGGGGLVAIGASTGGPPALERVFSGLGAGLPAAFLVVQHLPAGFTSSFVQRLDRVTGMRVVEGADGMRVVSGFAYVAPHGTHMVVEAGRGADRIRLLSGPPVHGVMPAVEPLIESIAEARGAGSVGVLLTGMGSDGARALGSIVEAGGVTIAQDEPTSVVWGMPGSAVKLGTAQRVVPLAAVAEEIGKALREGAPPA